MNADVSSDGFDASDGENMMNTSDDEIPRVSWADLPSIAVEHIYAYLSREDQIRMSEVCLNWNREYACPSLWREFKFLVPEEDLDLEEKYPRRTYEVFPEVQFARKYGRWFHHLEIVWPDELWHSTMSGCRNSKFIWTQIKLFLEALDHSQLQNVSFIRLKKTLRYNPEFCGIRESETANDVYQTIKHFFSSQHALKTVVFRDARFLKSEVAQILGMIFSNSKNLQNVSLLGVFTQYENVRRRSVGNEAVDFEPFLNAKTLQVQYSQYFEIMLRNFYERNTQNSDSRRIKGKLELIEIFGDVFQDDHLYQGIPPECWELLTEICPSLKVNFTFEHEYCTLRGIDFCVVRNMPVNVLEIKYGKARHGWEVEIGEVFEDLRSSATNKCVEDLRIDWRQVKDDLATDLIDFLQTCEKLKTFQLCVEHPVESDLDAVFSSWIQNRPPSLQSASITVRKVQRKREAAIYSKMADDYRPLLQALHNLELRLIVDDSTVRLR